MIFFMFSLSAFEDKQKQRRKSIEQRPIFGNSQKMSASASVSSSASSMLLQSISTSSTILSQPLPYQRHAKTKLSHRGELKQKLGWAIKASYKDPFKSESYKTQTVLSPNPAGKIQRQLGIKLKSSAQNEQPNQSQDSKKEDRSSSCSTDEQHSSPEKDDDCTRRLADSDGMLLHSNSFSDHGLQNVSQKNFANDNQRQNDSLSDPRLTCAVSSDHTESKLATDINAGLRTMDESCLDNRSKTPGNMASREESYSSVTPPPDTSNTGLQNLMCSYGSSDSDSSE